MPSPEQLLAMKAERERRANPLLRLMVHEAVSEAEQLEQDAREEKALVAEMDKRMRAVGFVVVNYSQPRASKQTPGIPDREYFHPGRGLFAKWEAKTPRGAQSPAQQQYQVWCDACGVPYLVGPPIVVETWCRTNGLELPPP